MLTPLVPEIVAVDITPATESLNVTIPLGLWLEYLPVTVMFVEITLLIVVALEV